jgi:acid phosphatase
LDGVSSHLKQVWLITRHGDRSPTGNFPKLHQWEILGELTGEGMDQLYRLGSKIRKKYIQEMGFIPSNYTADTIYVRSTDKDRTLMSAQSFIYGLYPLGTGPASSIFKMDGDKPRPYNFQPVPIHTENSKTDLLLYAYKNCPPLDELLKERKQTNEWKTKEIETESFRDILAQQIGVKELPLSKIPGVYHSLKAEMVHKRIDLIEFGITDDDFNRIEKIKNWVLARKYYTRRTGQIGAGILLSSIIQQMEMPSEENSDRFIYYSGHDGTLLALFSAMGFLPENIDVPHYSSYLIFELHEYNGTSFVHLEFNGKTMSGFNNISLSEFKSEMKPGFFTELEYKSYCQEPVAVPSSQPFQTLLYYFSYLFVFLLGFFLSSRPNYSKSIKQQ